MTKHSRSDFLLHDLTRSCHLRSKSMVSTIFGDVVSLYSGRVSLISLIKIMCVFGFSERLTRTSVYRLYKEKLLVRHRKGNASLYSLSDQAHLLFETSKKKIYTKVITQTETYWSLVYTGDIDSKTKAFEFEKRLTYHGFSYLNRRMMFSLVPKEEAYSIARELKLANQVIIFKAQLTKYTDLLFVKQLIRQHWRLDQVIANYECFIRGFSPLLDYITKKEISGQEALQLRLLVIHEYRKTILKDPFLPKTWQPSYWPYEKSYQICSQIYQRIYQQSSTYLEKNIFKFSASEHQRFCI